MHAVTREIDLDLPAAELWELIATAEGWQQWLVDDATMAIAPGSDGRVVDDGVARQVLVREVVDGRRVAFHWSEPDRADDLSLVTLELVDAPDGRPRLRVTEQWLAVDACAECPLRAAERWELRACLLCVRAAAAATATCPA